MYNGPTFSNEFPPKWGDFHRNIHPLIPHWISWGDDYQCNKQHTAHEECDACYLWRAIVVHWDDALDIVLHNIARLLLAYNTKNGQDEENNTLSFTFNQYMSWQWYLVITLALQLIGKPPPANWDKFWHAWEMILAWNENMWTKFSTGRALCLDMLMSIWHSRWTCPGCVFCPHKPHPFGNEYHMACCILLSLMFLMEMVEGKGHPPQVSERWSKLRKTTGLLITLLLNEMVHGSWLWLLCVEASQDDILYLNYI